MNRLEKDRPYHCRREGATQTGNLLIDDRGMHVRLYDFEKFFHIGETDSLHLSLEDSRCVSMHDIVRGASGRSMLGQRHRVTYFEEIFANCLVIGNHPWHVDDKIGAATFNVRQLKPILHNASKLNQMARRSLGFRPFDPILFDICCAAVRVRGGYAGAGSLELGLNEWWPQFELVFDQPRSLQSYALEMNRALRFFSAVAGFRLTPSEITISRSELCCPSGRARHKCDDHYQVEYVWPSPAIPQGQLHSRRSFANAWDKRELRNLMQCLKSWLERQSHWEEASTLMMGTLGLNDEISGERLIMACRWMEKIPGAEAAETVNNDDLAAISNAAANRASELGLARIEQRLRDSIGKMKLETRRERFSRLVAIVEQQFPKCGINAASVDDLMNAQRMRGQAAHGLLPAEGGALHNLQRALTATEALCYLLMIRDLPLTPKARERVASNRLVQDYHFAKALR